MSEVWAASEVRAWYPIRYLLPKNTNIPSSPNEMNQLLICLVSVGDMWAWPAGRGVAGPTAPPSTPGDTPRIWTCKSATTNSSIWHDRMKDWDWGGACKKNNASHNNQ